ncbi:MAG: diguanylate cyclase domain-containing protein [Pirellulaceae bacterium]
MDNTTPATGPPPVVPRDPLQSANARLAAVSALLDNAQDEVPALTPETEFENRLVQVRLGMASSLFAALRAKHGPTASHSLRVAMGCSSWLMLQKIQGDPCDEIEVAALLHDIGKIGVPDSVLLKPGRLSADEHVSMEQQRKMGAEILRACCVSQNMLDIVLHSGGWFDGRREGQTLRGVEIPLGARMVAIVDAFDAMTTDQVYRRAMSRERALAELFEFAGTQFDPDLVKDFCTFISADQVQLSAAVARRWLSQLQGDSSNGLWHLSPLPMAAAPLASTLFQEKLLESMHDAVIFVDDTLRITHWNRAAERLTGIGAGSVQQKHWTPSLLGLRDERQKLVSEAECPILAAIQSGEEAFRRFSLQARHDQRVQVDAHLVPVHGKGNSVHGAAMLLHDASQQITLEQRLKSLHEKATRDPLTHVANRAEFDRTQDQYVNAHLEKREPCSLIICDLDHFKKINDGFGHQAGDAVLINFAALLKRYCRPGDLVARYGGEEFVMLCADCNNATATQRADEIRQELEDTAQPALGGKNITSSFGVTELQEGDTPETMLRRADRALYQAKEHGRNRVVQLGAGITGAAEPPRKASWFSWLFASPVEQLLEKTLVTAVPLNIVVEKLKGFIADHHAEVVPMDDRRVALKIDAGGPPNLRRTGDREVPFVIDLEFEEANASCEGRGQALARTLINVAIRPQRSRDRRQRDVLDRARQLLVSLKSYLVAQEQDAITIISPTSPPTQPVAGMLELAQTTATPWMNKKD